MRQRDVSVVLSSTCMIVASITDAVTNTRTRGGG